MANTVIGFFNDRSEAADAVSQLTRAGFSREDIDVSNGSASTTSMSSDSGSLDSDYSDSSSTGNRDTSEHKGNAITRFFSSLFGDDSDDAKKYSDVSQSADSIVTVHASTRELAEEAANILDASGAIDIDEGALSDESYARNTYGQAGSITGSTSGSLSDMGGSTRTSLTSSELAAAGINSGVYGNNELDATDESQFGTNNRMNTTGDVNTDVLGTGTIGNGDLASGMGPGGMDTGSTGVSGDYSDAVTGSTGTGARSADLGTDYNTGAGSIAGTGYAGTTGFNDDLTGSDASYATTSSDNLSSGGNSQDRIDVIREDLQVGKRSVETGGVRVRSRIIERPVEESLRLREEHVRVQRNPVNRPVSLNDMGTFQEKEIELTEHAEVPVVSKEARVVEEIRVSKEVNERNETIRDTVRETQVDVEDDRNRSNRREVVGAESNYNNDDVRDTDLNSGRS